MSTAIQNKMQKVTASLNGLYQAMTDVYAQKDALFKLRANAFGSGLTYQWQVKSVNSPTWQNSTATGADTAEITSTALLSRDGYMWRCIVTSNGGKQITSPVRLRVIDSGKSYDCGTLSVLSASYATESAVTALSNTVNGKMNTFTVTSPLTLTNNVLGMADSGMVLLNDFTTTEAVDFVQTQDSDGTDYDLEGAFVWVTFPEFSGSVTSPYVMFGSGSTYVGLAICAPVSKADRWCSCVQDDSPFWICRFASGGTSRTYSSLSTHTALASKDTYQSITKIYSYPGRPFPVGTRIRIYGRKRGTA